MKNLNTKSSLDDIAFEGRNQEYGAYLLRKTYQSRLFSSFMYSLCVFFLIMLLFAGIVHPDRADDYLNSQLGVKVVGIRLSNNPITINTVVQSRGVSSTASTVPEYIVADEEVITQQEKPITPSDGSTDSTDTSQNGTGETGTGSSTAASEGITGEIYGSADINPQFPGGIKAMQEFIKENMQYAKDTRRQAIRGSILIYVVITSDGSVKDVKVVKGLLPALDEEAVRVVRSMPTWKPAMRGGVPVNVGCIIPISVSPL